MNLISLPPCAGPSPFSQRKTGSKWAPPDHSRHYPEPGWFSTPGLRGDRRPLSSDWHAGGSESRATRESKRECFEESPPFPGPRLSSCHLSGTQLWRHGGILASCLCVLSPFLSPSVHFLHGPLYKLTGATERGIVWSGANTNSSLL